MSVEAQVCVQAIRLPPGNSSAKFVLWVLANHASGDPRITDEIEAWPCIQTLRDSTDQDRKTIINNLKKLADWGLIEDTGKRRGRTKQVVVWRLRIGPDLISAALGDVQPRSVSYPSKVVRNSPNTGTVPKSEPSQSSAERVPILVGKGPNFGTRNPKNHQGTSISGREPEPADAVGHFEGHAEPAETAAHATATTAGSIAVALRQRGFRITSQDRELVAGVAEGITCEAVLEFAELYPADHAKCRGSPGYVLSAARRQLAEQTEHARGGTHANRHPASRASTGGGGGPAHGRPRESRAGRFERKRREAEARIGSER